MAGVAHLKCNVFALFAHTGSKQTAILAGASRAVTPFPVVEGPGIAGVLAWCKGRHFSGNWVACLSTCGILQTDFESLTFPSTFVGKVFGVIAAFAANFRRLRCVPPFYSS